MADLWRCVNCGRNHSTIRIFNIIKGRFISLEFCSDKCLQKFHKNHDIGVLETPPKKNGYPIYQDIKNEKKIVGHMDEIILWIRPKMKITLTLSKNANFISRLKRFEEYTKINGVNVPIYKYDVTE